MAFDFADILDATKPVTVSFLGKEIVCEVYTFGWERVSVETSASIEKLSESAKPSKARLAEVEQELKIARETTPANIPALETEAGKLYREIGIHTVALSRAMAPVMIKSWTIDGEPLNYQQNEITPLDAASLPAGFDGLITAAVSAAGDVFGSDSEKKALVSSLPLEPEVQALATSATN